MIGLKFTKILVVAMSFAGAALPLSFVFLFVNLEQLSQEDYGTDGSFDAQSEWLGGALVARSALELEKGQYNPQSLNGMSGSRNLSRSQKYTDGDRSAVPKAAGVPPAVVKNFSFSNVRVTEQFDERDAQMVREELRMRSSIDDSALLAHAQSLENVRLGLKDHENRASSQNFEARELKFSSPESSL